MKVTKITFKNDQCWVVLKDPNDKYIVTFHIVDPVLVEILRKDNPEELFFKDNRKNE